MDSREVQKVLDKVKNDLSYIVGVSGKPQDLVKLTTSLVQGIKKLIVGVPDDLSTYSTSVLTDFVKAARHVAKNPRAVDSKCIQDLSNSRKLVEKAVDQLEKWHFSGSVATYDEGCSFAEADGDSQLTDQLLRQKDVLFSKKEPQKSVIHLTKPMGALLLASNRIVSILNDLIVLCEEKYPTRAHLIKPTLVGVDIVCTLLDVVDSLFVTKYPMRSQVNNCSLCLIT